MYRTQCKFALRGMVVSLGKSTHSDVWILSRPQIKLPCGWLTVLSSSTYLGSRDVGQRITSTFILVEIVPRIDLFLLPVQLLPVGQLI